MTKHYVEYCYPGSFFSEYDVKEVAERDVKLPQETNGFLGKPFAYSFYDREETILDGETLTGKEKNRSGKYYWGELYTLDQVKALGKKFDILASNMEGNDYPMMIKTSRGNWQPFFPDKDILLTE